MLCLAQNHAAAGSAQHLVRCERDDIGVRHRTRDRFAGHETDEVRRIHHHDRAHLITDGPERSEVNQPRIGSCAADNHARLVFESETAHLVIVNEFGVLPYAIRHDVEPLAREVDLRSVGEVAAMRKAHRKHCVARFSESAVDRDVCAGAAMRLQIGMFGAEESLCALNSDDLGLVDLATTAVVALARVTLSVLIAQDRPESREHCRGSEIFAGDEL